MFNVQVTMDEHMKAMEWLELNLQDQTFDFDDISAMVEQLTVGGL